MASFKREQIIALMAFVLLLVALPFIILAIQIASDPRTKANPAYQPREVIFSNLTGSSLTVSFKTDEAVEAYATAGTQRGDDLRDAESGTAAAYKLHYVVIKNLSPDTQYEIKLYSGGQEFSDPTWTAKTPPVGDSVGVPDTLFGKVSDASVTEALVYAMAGDTAANSTIISTLMRNPTFTLDKNAMLTPAGEKVSMDGKDILFYVDAGDKGEAKVQFAAKESRVPDVTLSTTNVTFTAADKITPGSQPTNPPPTTEPPVNPPPTDGEYFLDTESEALLTSTYSSGAEVTNPDAPYDIFIANVSQNGFQVFWRTKNAATGFVEVLESGVVSEIVDPRDGSVDNAKKRFTHTAKASSGQLPAGKVVEFQIVSNGVRYGRNLQAISDDYNGQFKAYADQYYPHVDKSETTPANSAASETDTEADTALSYRGAGPTNESSQSGGLTDPKDIPAFIYIPDSALQLQPFKVIIPATPDSPPQPIVQQGSVSGDITVEQHQTALNGIGAILPKFNVASFAVDRDYIIAVRTDGSWVADTVTESFGFSLSMGSGLDADKSGYITPKSGDTMSLLAFGPLNQEATLSTTAFSDNPIVLKVEGPQALLSVEHNTVVTKPLLYGFTAKGTPSLDVNVNQIGTIADARSDGSWQVTADNEPNIKAGLNIVSLGVNNPSQQVQFVVDVTELPVTGLIEDWGIQFLGIVLVFLGVAIYVRYMRRVKNSARH